MFWEYLRPDFRIGHYGQMVDEKMTRLAAADELEVAIGNSAGSLATMGCGDENKKSKKCRL